MIRHRIRTNSSDTVSFNKAPEKQLSTFQEKNKSQLVGTTWLLGSANEIMTSSDLCVLLENSARIRG